MIAVVTCQETGTRPGATVVKSEFAVGIRKYNGRVEVDQVRVIFGVTLGKTDSVRIVTGTARSAVIPGMETV